MESMISLFGPDTNSSVMPNCLPPEVEEGNIEYKLKLINPSEHRFEHLVTQMKWRLQEGNGEAVYEIGVEDNGILAGLTALDMQASLNTLRRMAEHLSASVTILREQTVDISPGEQSRKVTEVLVRKVPDDQQFIDLRMAVLGNADSGKSTLLGVLTHGELDNGQGRARLNLFRHLHEIQSGRTSSISHEILGFNSHGDVINYCESRTAEEICENSTKLITLIDLAGHQKYLKTTIFGLTGHSPHFAVLVVSANTGVAGTTKEHLGFALALEVPIFVVVNKIDMVRSVTVEKTIQQLEKILLSPGCKKVPYRVKNENEAVSLAANFNTGSIAPIFTVSCVTGKNLELITTFLNVLPPAKSLHEREKLSQEYLEFQVDEVYCVPRVGTVVGGTLVRGVLTEGDSLLAGPTDDGCFLPAVVHSVQRNRVPCRIVQAGQAASVAVMQCEIPMRKGMVLLSPSIAPVCCLEFEADIYVLYHVCSIRAGFQTTVHVGNVRQTAIIAKMDRHSVSTNQKAVVVFRFIKQPEFIRIGSRLLFREGNTKGMGEITKVFPYIPNTETNDR